MASSQANPAAQEKLWVPAPENAVSATPTVYEPSRRSASEEAPEKDDARGVDVNRAERQFAELQREFTRQSKGAHGIDAEKQDDDEWDLQDYLRSSSKEARDAGIRHKSAGVTWTDLSVVGAGGMKIHLRTFPDAVKEFLLSPLIILGPYFGLFTPAPKPILQNFNGVARPGEMILVLGRPGSGCSTFLKSIANQREGYLSVDGDVRYAGIEATEFKKRFAGEVLYNAEDDMHHPTLTVEQTLDFALSTKTPGKRVPGQTKTEFRAQVIDTLLKMLNITHTRKTLVGNEFVRGISGGERKRVSIAEMFATNAVISSWDNSTRGLDASTALDYAKSLRIMTDVYQMVNFVSLYQAGEGIYDQFDKVLVIDEGRQIYFGPVKEARQYFLSLGFKDLPRQTTADYLTGCTDPNERQFAEGRSEADVPSTPQALERAFHESKHWGMMAQERDDYTELVAKDTSIAENFRLAVKEQKGRFVRSKSPYSASFFTQVRALARRHTQLKLQDWFSIFTSYFTSIAIALIVGSLYLNLPQTAAGAFTRGGVLFIGLLFNSLNAFSELPSQMQGRPILYKQTNFLLYRPSAVSLAAQIADIPFSALQIFLFCVIIYFMSGLERSAGAFFIFYLIIYTTFLAMTSFFRLIGTTCRSYDVAARLAAVLISGMVLYTGYMIPVYAMKRWLFWIYYIDPLNYGFSALMINEFMRVNLECTAPYLIPYGPSYENVPIANKVCTLPGAVTGEPFVAGRAYIEKAFQYKIGDLWRNWGILLAFFIGFQLIQMALTEFIAHGAHASAITVYKPEDKDTRERNARLQARKEDFRKGTAQQNLEGLIKTRKPFTWENLCYTVPVPGGHKQLLDNVFGYVKPGTLTALMGASGAGKTTLLDVLAQRKTIGVIGGDVRIAGRPVGIEFQRGTAYVEQQDVHEWTTTVREALRFSAYLRQPHEIPQLEKDDYVEEIIQLLEMEDIADAMIGFPGYGLGVEARKRLTIGVELAAKPQLLLFLDEPTSGLDGQSAYNIVRFLKKLAAAGQAILCTIHQPNALLFEQFDRLLLLERGGRTVYFGPIGKDSQHLTRYMSEHGAVCPPASNPAEYMLDAIGAGSQKRVGDRDWADVYLDSPLFEENKREITALNERSVKEFPDMETGGSAYASPFMYQLKVVGKRTFLSFWRMPDYGFTRLFSHMVIALFTSLTFLNIGNSASDLQYRVFVIFIATVMPALILAQVEPTYIMSRNIFIREDSSKMYSPWVFSLAQLVSEMPNSLLCSVGFFLLLTYPAGFYTESSRAGYQFLIILVTEIFSVTLGQAVAALSPNIFIAALFNPFLLLIFSMFCGVTVPKPNMPKFWREWMYQLDPFTRLISGMMSTELQDRVVQCKTSELQSFNPVSGQTCGVYAKEFLSMAAGYITNPDATENCHYCQYSRGQDFFNALDVTFGHRWRDLGIFASYVVFNIAVTLIASRFLKYAKR